MNATRVYLCIITLTLVSITIPTHWQGTAAGSGSTGTTPGGTDETGKSAMPETANPNGTMRGMPPAAKRRQQPIPRDRYQALEERLRSGQMEKPIAQGEISERLDQLSRGSNSSTGETAIGHSSR